MVFISSTERVVAGFTSLRHLYTSDVSLEIWPHSSRKSSRTISILFRTALSVLYPRRSAAVLQNSSLVKLATSLIIGSIPSSSANSTSLAVNTFGTRNCLNTLIPSLIFSNATAISVNPLRQGERLPLSGLLSLLQPHLSS